MYLGFCEGWQLTALSGKAKEIPKSCECHSSCFPAHKEEAATKNQAATKTTTRVVGKGRMFYMDFGFLRTSSFNYAQPSVTSNRVVV